ncbi:unnamed protein product, partial [Mesorhabditis belari]|uniref:C-type lectin domain-containing protein n=1 Tax=Mesorhabditis belari TaxID=2138241 RepID=A0AAF3ECG3_9BILA
MFTYLLLAFVLAASIRADCPPGSQQIPNEFNCVYAVSNGSSFDSAYVTCEKLGGLPFEIKNVFENAYLRALIDIFFNGSPAFIGVQKGEGNRWVYSDGTPLIYNNWGKGQPAQSNLACAQLDSATSEWSTVSCAQKLPYFCQVPYYQNLNTTLAPINSTSTPFANSTSWPSNYTQTPYANSTNWPSNFTLAPANTTNWPSNFTLPPANTTNWPSNFTLPPANTTNFPSNFTLPPANSTNWPSNFTLTPAANSTNFPGNFTNSPSNFTNPIFSNSSVTFPAYNYTAGPSANGTTPSPLVLNARQNATVVPVGNYTGAPFTLAPNVTLPPFVNPNSTNTPPQASTTSFDLERLVGKAFMAGLGLVNH